MAKPAIPHWDEADNCTVSFGTDDSGPRMLAKAESFSRHESDSPQGREAVHKLAQAYETMAKTINLPAGATAETLASVDAETAKRIMLAIRIGVIPGGGGKGK